MDTCDHYLCNTTIAGSIEARSEGGDEEVPRCKSCGVPFHDHLGLVGTCKKYIDARIRIESLETECAKLKKNTNQLTKKLDAANAVRKQEVASLRESVASITIERDELKLALEIKDRQHRLLNSLNANIQLSVFPHGPFIDKDDERRCVLDCRGPAMAKVLAGFFAELLNSNKNSSDEARLQLVKVARERDELRRRAGSNQSIGVDFGMACGRYYLSVCGHVVAVEGDTQRDVQLSRQFGPAWNKEAIDYVVATAKEQDKNLDQARKQFEAAKAEAAELLKYVDAQTNTISTGGRLSWHDGSLDEEFFELKIPIGVVRRFAIGTAGRDFLDRHAAEIAAKDAEIATIKAKAAKLDELIDWYLNPDELIGSLAEKNFKFREKIKLIRDEVTK